MLEMLVNPKKAERRPWEMFFVGLFYASLSILLVDWIFLRDSVLSGYTSMLIITFSVMFTIPFMYFIIRLEEKKDAAIKREYDLLREHGKAIAALTYLFLGFIVAFAFWFLVMPPATTAENFKSQIAQYCAINMPQQFERCLSQQGISVTGIGGKFLSARIASGTPLNYFTSILINNIYVLIFILIFSFAFGAGAIFILAWNASVIAAAIGIFAGLALQSRKIKGFQFQMSIIIMIWIVGEIVGVLAKNEILDLSIFEGVGRQIHLVSMISIVAVFWLRFYHAKREGKKFIDEIPN